MVWVVSRFRLKAPPGTSSPYISPLTSSGQRNCASWASQPQKSVTLPPQPGGGPRKFVWTCGGIRKRKKEKKGVDRTRTEDRFSPALFFVSVQILEELCVSLHRNCWIGHKGVSHSMHTAVSWFVRVRWGPCLFTGFWRHSSLNRHCSPSNTVIIFVSDCYITPDTLQTV